MAGAAALVLLLAGGAAQAQDHAARVDRFLAALPPEATADAGEPQPDEAERAALDALLAANPGKEAPIRAASTVHLRCNADAMQRLVQTGLRTVAERMTDAELTSLTAFYTGPDYARVAAAGPDADLSDLLQRYPLQRFAEVTQAVMTDSAGSAFEQFAACDAAYSAQLDRDGVKEAAPADAPAAEEKKP